MLSHFIVGEESVNTWYRGQVRLCVGGLYYDEKPADWEARLMFLRKIFRLWQPRFIQLIEWSLLSSRLVGHTIHSSFTITISSSSDNIWSFYCFRSEIEPFLRWQWTIRIKWRTVWWQSPGGPLMILLYKKDSWFLFGISTTKFSVLHYVLKI